MVCPNSGFVEDMEDPFLPMLLASAVGLCQCECPPPFDMSNVLLGDWTALLHRQQHHLLVNQKPLLLCFIEVNRRRRADQKRDSMSFMYAH